MGEATYTPKNILITGETRFIASHVANRLMRNYPHYKIVVLDKLDYCSNLKNLLPSMSSKNFKFVKGDIGSADLVNYLLITEVLTPLCTLSPKLMSTTHLATILSSQIITSMGPMCC
jgi:nucleoside-diphosphate-sugar epimerase